MNTKERLSQIKKKAGYLLLMFVVFITNMTVYGQDLAFNRYQDSVLIETQDSIIKLGEQKDSLANIYVFVDPNRPNPKLDSLRQLLVVTDNDFISWMKYTDDLVKKKGIATMQAIAKVDRPMWVIGVLVLLLTGLGIIRLLFYNTFHNIISGFFNDRVLGQLSKEDNVMTSWPYIFLYTIFSFSLGLFIVLYQTTVDPIIGLTFLYFMKVSMLVALLFVAKILLIRIIAVVFEVDRLVREYVVVLYLVYFNSMLVLLPLLLFVAFSPVAYFKIVLIFFVFVVSILFLYRFLRTAFSLVGNLKFSIFYLILYLCSLEIAPILILVKTLNS